MRLTNIKTNSHSNLCLMLALTKPVDVSGHSTSEIPSSNTDTCPLGNAEFTQRQVSKNESLSETTIEPVDSRICNNQENFDRINYLFNKLSNEFSSISSSMNSLELDPGVSLDCMKNQVQNAYNCLRHLQADLSVSAKQSINDLFDFLLEAIEKVDLILLAINTNDLQAFQGSLPLYEFIDFLKERNMTTKGEIYSGMIDYMIDFLKEANVEPKAVLTLSLMNAAIYTKYAENAIISLFLNIIKEQGKIDSSVFDSLYSYFDQLSHNSNDAKDDLIALSHPLVTNLNPLELINNLKSLVTSFKTRYEASIKELEEQMSQKTKITEDQ